MFFGRGGGGRGKENQERGAPGERFRERSFPKEEKEGKELRRLRPQGLGGLG